jgi:hypothetical protein
MSDPAPLDIAKISPPAEPPSDAPDQNTANEEKDLRRLTPTEQLARSHLRHIEELNGHVAFHRNECDQWRQEVEKLQRC